MESIFQVFVLLDRNEVNTRHKVWMGMIEQSKLIIVKPQMLLNKWLVQVYIQHMAYNWLIVGYDPGFST